MHQRIETAFEPVGDRNAEAFFLAVQDVCGEQGFERLFENVFALRTVKLVIQRQRCGKLADAGIEERSASFERGRPEWEGRPPACLG